MYKLAHIIEIKEQLNFKKLSDPHLGPQFRARLHFLDSFISRKKIWINGHHNKNGTSMKKRDKISRKMHLLPTVP